MSLRSEPWRRCVCLAALLLAASGAAAQEAADQAIEQYLESHGLDALLAVQLHDRIERTPSNARAPIAERLAALYAELIESTNNAQRRAALEARARELVSQTPPTTSAALRLNLERARYAQAERAAERARLRLAEPGELEQALSDMATMAPALASIALNAHQQTLAIQQQEESGRDYDPQLLAVALREARRQRSLGFYLSGWCNAYLAEMNNAPANAREALKQFGWLLGADVNEPPQIDRVPARSMQYEHVARSAIGVAVAYAAMGDGAQALDWLDFVEDHADTPQAIRAQLPGRRLTILAKLQRWNDLAKFAAQRRGDTGLEAGEARLVVVLALENIPERDAELRRRTAQAAFADLIQRQELAHVVDLASRYGTNAIAGGGFIGSYVRGLMAYESARDAHESASKEADLPTTNATVAREYRSAAELLRTALSSADIVHFDEARPATRMLLGLSLYYASGVEPRLVEEAVATFLQAADEHGDEAHAADALWMAHRTARRLPGDEGETRGVAIARQFIQRFSKDERAGVLRVQSAVAGEMPAEDAVATLLETPRESPAYETAQRHAARLLYDLYRAAPANERDWAALRYAACAEPLLAQDRARAQAGDSESAQLAVVRARRLLDALLSIQAPDAARAQSALESLESVAALHASETPPAAEIAFRKLQIALARNDESSAAQYAAEIRRLEASEGGDFSEHAERALFHHVAQRWRVASETTASPTELAEAARLVVARGAPLLARLEQNSRTDSAALLSIQNMVAHAAFDLWSVTQEPSALELAYRRHQLALEAQPLDRGGLRRLALLSEATGDVETALSCWRQLSSGLAPESDAWFEARVRLIELLAEHEPARAADALRQHIALRPDLGPAPWAERLRTLAFRLGVPVAPPDSEEAAS